MELEPRLLLSTVFWKPAVASGITPDTFTIAATLDLQATSTTVDFHLEDSATSQSADYYFYLNYAVVA